MLLFWNDAVFIAHESNRRAAVARQILYFLCGEDLSGGRGFALNQRRLSRNYDRLRRAADFQLYVFGDGLSGLDLDSAMYVFFKTRGDRRDLIRAGLKERNGIVAIGA